LTLLLSLPAISNADWFVDFVKITCIPEARYFAFESKPIQGSYVLGETQFDSKLRAKRFALWEQKGYYNPSALEFTCNLPGSTYKIIATQPEPSDHGMCAGDPDVTLSLYKNNDLIVSKVIFGSACSGDSVQSIEISEPLQGWGSNDFYMCLNRDPNSHIDSQPNNQGNLCELLSDTYEQFPSVKKPVNMEEVNKFLESK
jgi:hypothetical protein